MGAWVGGWVGGWVVSYVGECFRACGRWRAPFFFLGPVHYFVFLRYSQSLGGLVVTLEYY